MNRDMYFVSEKTKKIKKKGENMSLSYKEWNDVIRSAVDKHTKIVSKLKLPNTVMLQFRKDESKKLSIDTFTKLIEGLDLTYKIEVLDENGQSVDAATFESIVAEKAGDSKKDTLATIAGVSSKKTSAKKAMPDADDIMSGTGEVQIGSGTMNASDAGVSASSEDGLAASSSEVAIDLNEIFGN